jgi:hypothetical protein
MVIGFGLSALSEWALYRRTTRREDLNPRIRSLETNGRGSESSSVVALGTQRLPLVCSRAFKLDRRDTAALLGPLLPRLRPKTPPPPVQKKGVKDACLEWSLSEYSGQLWILARDGSVANDADIRAPGRNLIVETTNIVGNPVRLCNDQADCPINPEAAISPAFTISASGISSVPSNAITDAIASLHSCSSAPRVAPLLLCIAFNPNGFFDVIRQLASLH